MKAEIILTDNNINIDLNEPTIDVSTEDGFSVTITGGVGPQGNRGPEGPKGEKGDDYVLTEEDKDDIADLAAENTWTAASKLTHDSLVSILSRLATVNETRTITLGQNNRMKLSTEEIAVATQKGWTIA